MYCVTICGVRIDNVTLEQGVKAALRERSHPCVVTTPNAVMLDVCRKDRSLRELLNRSTLSLADGAGVLLAAKRQKTPLCERVAGIEFGEALLGVAAREGLRVFLLGGKSGVAERAAERLRERYTGLCIAGTQDGYFQKSGGENARVTDKIAASEADILFVCLGFPLQERWINENLPSLGGLRIIAALGGSLDVWAGNVSRAPKLISHMGLEWAWRMMREPKRLRHLPALIRFGLFGGR
jgi:N-acetylglucosaminyldiphosphoundecaprenol N-acetyl-beta-D-mannosaminyltransferase